MNEIEYLTNNISESEDFSQWAKNYIKTKPSATVYEIKSDSEWKDVSEQLKSVRAQLKEFKELEKKEKALEERLISMAFGKNAMGNGICVSKVTRKGSIDYDSISQVMNIESYRKPNTEYWRISEE